MNSETWFGILDLAEEYGWNPMGTVLPGQFYEMELALAGYYLGGPMEWYGDEPDDTSRLVMLEDALNLADSLEQAFLDYEPVRVPASFYLFEPSLAVNNLPAIGTLNEVVDFCRCGAFWIERYQKNW